MTVVEVHEGDGPLVLGFPHTGTDVALEIAARLNTRGRQLTDTDWHVHRLYDGLLEGATTVRATFHRYVIDANRDPTGRSLYSGQNTTDLVPRTDFDNNAIWRLGAGPAAADIAARLDRYHAPYHAALAEQLQRVRSRLGVVILLDCHSIRSHCPFLFPGRLPDFNIGDNDGATCDPAVRAKVEMVCARAGDYNHVVNGRFKGGWTTRHYGRPVEGFHAIQMELAQSTYLSTEAQPFAYDEVRATPLRSHLSEILRRLSSWATAHEGAAA